jgi:hypothetical protein
MLRISARKFSLMNLLKSEKNFNHATLNSFSYFA